MTSRSSLVVVADQAGLSDLGKGLDTAIEILGNGEENHRVWRLRRWATALVRYISLYSADVAVRMAEVKRFFALCRENALRMGLEKWDSFPPPPRPYGASVMEHRRQLHQLSRVSRSLRQPTETVVLESLEAHWELSQTPFETPEYLRRSFRNFIRFRFGGTAEAGFSGVGTSSSFLRTMGQGGVPEEIREITNAYRDKEVSFFSLLEAAQNLPEFVKSSVSILYREDTIKARFFGGKARASGTFKGTVKLGDVLFPYDKASELSLEDWEARREILFSLSACWSAIDFSELPRCRQVPVKERGFKTRVATPLEAPFRYLLGVINAGLLSVLECMPEVTSALHGRPAYELDWTRGKRRGCVLSADLKSATDYFPQDLMMDAVDVLSEHWPAEFRLLAKRAVGPHVLHHFDGERSAPTMRGILMGSPISWPLLSIYSAWLHKESGSDGWFGVCGDDYIGCHTKASLARYNRVRKETGAVPSPGKDMVAFQSVGVFAEDLVTVARGRVHPTVSIRAVLADSKAGCPSWSQGPEVTDALGVLRLSPRVSNLLCARIHKSSFHQLRRAGIDPCAPRWCGGAGFPGLPAHPSYILARRLVSQSRDLVIRWVTRLETAWSPMSASEDLTCAVEEDIQRHADSQWDSGVPGSWGPLRDVVSLRLATLSWPFLLAGAVKRERRVKLGSVRRRITLVKEEIASRGYWIPSSSDVRSGEALAAMLQELEPRSVPIRFTPIALRFVLVGPAVDQISTRKRKLDAVGEPGWGAPSKKVSLPKFDSASVRKRIGDSPRPKGRVAKRSKRSF